MLELPAALAQPSFMREIPTVPFLDFRLAACGVDEFVDAAIEAAGDRTKKAPVAIGYLNAAQVNLAADSPAAGDALRRLDLLYADGQAVVWAARWLGRPVPERINAGDFTLEFFRRCAEAKLKVALVGGHPGDPDRFARYFRERVPGLNFVYVQHGYITGPALDWVTEEIEEADPDIVLVGMGAPRQESFALRAAGRGRPRVWWCVGALFEYYAGRRRRAPVWMRRAGMEWLFRFVLEPGRLWRRYVIGNPRFVYRVWKYRGIIHHGDTESTEKKRKTNHQEHELESTPSNPD